MKNKKDIVITGMGNITPLGNTVPTAWNNLVNGKNGVGLIESFDVSNFSTRIGAEVKILRSTSLIKNPVEEWTGLCSLQSRQHMRHLLIAEFLLMMRTKAGLV